jgi:hypothetical protein
MADGRVLPEDGKSVQDGQRAWEDRWETVIYPLRTLRARKTVSVRWRVGHVLPEDDKCELNRVSIHSARYCSTHKLT